MSTRTLLNLALAALTTLLIAVIWMRPGLEPDTAPEAITSLAPEQVTSINITRLQGEPLGFRKQDDTWFIVDDPDIPADAFQVNAILSLLQATSVRSYPVDAIDLSGPGLDPPGASIMFNSTWIAIGDIDPIDNMRYVRTNTTIHLVADRYQHLLNAGYNNFVRRRLLPDAAQITALRLPGLALHQQDGVNWQLEPDNPDVGADAINTLIANWQRASALYVRRFEGGEYDTEISLALRGHEEPVVFTVVAREPDLVLARPEWGIQYHLMPDEGAGLLSLPVQPVK
jgi:hypothetical protein